MAYIQTTINGFDNGDNNFIFLTGIPNIITVKDIDINYAAQVPTITLTFSSTTLANKDDGRYSIDIMGEVISSVKYFENAINKNFWISPTSNASTAASVAKALRNCQTIAAYFTIENNSNVVTIKGRKIFETTINVAAIDNVDGSSISSFIAASVIDGQDLSDLSNANVSVDIYSGNSNDYVTTLEKICPETEVSFNISPVLTSIAEYGRTNKFTYQISYVTNDGAYSIVNDKNDYANHVQIGYMINQGYGRGNKQIDASEAMVAQNVQRGDSNPTFENHTLLYIYGDTLPISFFKGNYGGGNITITYRDSAYQEIGSATTTWQSMDSTNKMQEITLNLANGQPYQYYFNNAFYIDIDLGIGQQLRYNVIKPLKAAEGYTRLYFRNSYGGISFVDLTGKEQNSNAIENEKTYQKNIYDYQTTDYTETDIIYSKGIKSDITIKSHLFEKDGKWVYDDLLKASNVWLYINDEQYNVIVDSIQIEETDNNNIYEATVKIKFKQ